MVIKLVHVEYRYYNFVKNVSRIRRVRMLIIDIEKTRVKIIRW